MKYKVRALMLMLLMCWASQSAAYPTRAKKEYAMGACQGIYRFDPTDTTYGRGENSLGVSRILNMDGAAREYWGMKDIPEYVKSEQIQVIRQPKHGSLEYRAYSVGSRPSADYGHYIYTPEKGYLGNDKVIFKLEVNGKIFKVVYIFKVVHEDTVGNDDPGMYACKVQTWKISQFAIPNDTTTSNL